MSSGFYSLNEILLDKHEHNAILLKKKTHATFTGLFGDREQSPVLLTISGKPSLAFWSPQCLDINFGIFNESENANLTNMCDN